MPGDEDCGGGTFDVDVPLTLRTVRPPDDEPTDAALPSGLTLGAWLGEGGMGVVLSAEQRSLAREVAVKRPRTPSASLRARLVREAMVTGALAHPNVVPVYDLRTDDDGAPLLVMQRVQGRAWSTFLEDGPPAEGARDPLGWHARVLVQVCHAVAFAHARGVLHRDLKPQNVMIGRYGEVYVLDWGLALALPGCGIPGLPPAEGARGVAGTPAYMAPEQARGEALAATTDVWLLGALLYHLVHHRPPHRTDRDSSGTSALREILAVAARGEPDALPAPTPELDAVLRRALATAPADRYASVEAFRDALSLAIERREARSLLDEATTALGALRSAVAGEQARDVAVRVTTVRDATRRVLAAWPEDREALAAWREATDLAVDWHLRRGEPGAAELLLLDDPGAPPALRARITEARAVAKARDDRLRDVEDRRTGARTRAVVLLIAGTLWTAGPWLMEWYPQSRASWLAWSLLVLGVGIGLAVWARDSLSKSVLNRQVQLLLVLAPIVHLVAQLGGWAGGLSLATSTAMSLLGFVGMASAGVLVLGWRALPTFVTYAAAFPLALSYPEWMNPIYSASNLLFMISMYVVFWDEIRDLFREGRDGPPPA
jgi:hypothetical protein